MVKEHDTLTVEIDPESDLAKVLATSGAKQVTLVSDGQRYLVKRDPSARDEERDAEAFREAMRAAAGIFTAEEGERLKRNIYRWREEGSRPDERRCDI